MIPLSYNFLDTSGRGVGSEIVTPASLSAFTKAYISFATDTTSALRNKAKKHSGIITEQARRIFCELERVIVPLFELCVFIKILPLHKCM